MPGADRESRIRLLILYGGRSAEHEVSCVSAFHVLRPQLRPDRYDLSIIGITTDGRWIEPPRPSAAPCQSGTDVPRPAPEPAMTTAAAALEPVEALTEAGRAPL